MSVVSLPSRRTAPETELDAVLQLATTVSRRLTRARAEEIVPVIINALGDVAAAVHVETCRLAEFTQSGSVVCVHAPLRAGDPASGVDVQPWFLERLARGEAIEDTRDEHVTRPATHVRAASVLGLPVSLAGVVTCALVLEAPRWPRRWPGALVERLQLLAEIFGAALQRCRHSEANRAGRAHIERAHVRLEADNGYLKEEIKGCHAMEDIVGESAALRLALTRLAQVAPTNSSVLLFGQTGTGKELFARAVHERSRRNGRPLVRVNCAALPPTLVESELFGHEKGAFTGAVGLRQGRFELADGGTIFLDEIGDLTPDVQVRFLRVLQEGEFERVGSSRTRTVDVRVIAATHHDLEAAVAAGRFRADLYYRLSVYPIRLPSLSERREDIPSLVWFFINRHQRELGRTITKVPQAVMEALQNHDWPGNIRELENVVERAMIASDGDTLCLDDPHPFVRLATAVGGSDCLDPHNLDPDSLDNVQRRHIRAVLERCGWRINGAGNAAERLGVHPNTLRFRLQKLGISRPAGQAARRSELTEIRH
jgi:formate hydrogenlyase transcriptional activator